MNTTAHRNGARPVVKSILNGNFKTPDEVAHAGDMNAEKVDAILATIAEFAQPALSIALESVKGLIGELPGDERKKIGGLWDILKRSKDVDAFLASCPPPPGAPKFKPMGYAEFLAMPPKQWLIDQVIGAGDLAMVYGAPGCGKTFVEIDMIFAACLGKQWAMRFDVARPLNVAYCAGEGVSGLPERFAAAAEHHAAVNLPNFTFYAVTPQLYVGDDANYAESITNFVLEWKERQNIGQAQPLDILIIDTLHSATAGADENSAQDMGIVLRLAKRAATELGCAVVLVHHSNKAGTGERGSSALRGAMDCMIEVAKISETGTKAKIHCAKLKDGEAWKDQTFDLVGASEGNSVRVWWDELAESTTSGQKNEDKKHLLSEMERYSQNKFTVKSLAEVLAKAENYTRNLLAELEKGGQCIRELQDPTKSPSNRNSWVYSLVTKP